MPEPERDPGSADWHGRTRRPPPRVGPRSRPPRRGDRGVALRWTVSQEVWNASATSCHDSPLAHAVLAGGPRDGLDVHAAARARHAAHRVVENDREMPEGHEVEAPPRLGVVAGAPAAAPAAPRPGSGERGVLLDPIQDSLELHPVPLPRRLDVLQRRPPGAHAHTPGSDDAADRHHPRAIPTASYPQILRKPQVYFAALDGCLLRRDAPDDRVSHSPFTPFNPACFMTLAQVPRGRSSSPRNYAAYVPDLPGCVATGASEQEAAEPAPGPSGA